MKQLLFLLYFSTQLCYVTQSFQLLHSCYSKIEIKLEEPHTIKRLGRLIVASDDWSCDDFVRANESWD